jgi:hypothetical protein
MALPLLLLLLLALTALGHGVLLLSRTELRATWAFHHAERAVRAARAGAHVGLEDLEIDLDRREKGLGMPVASGESEDGLVFRSTLRWLGPEFFLLESFGGSRGWEGERRLAWVGWSLNPGARIGAFRGSYEVGGGITSQLGSLLEDEEFLEAPESWGSEVCRGYRTTLDSLFAHGPPPTISAPNPVEPVDSGPGAAIPPLGLLTGSLLLSRSGSTPSESGILEIQGGACPEEGRPTFVGTEGSLRIQGGGTCGLLVAGGDLRLGRDARIQGIALVGGDLILEPGARFHGMARIRGGIHLADGAVLGAQACPALWALDHLQELQEPLLLPHASRLNGF